ncbi:MAG TPA: FAD-dependent oxidoreductase [Candidatus Tumulicola sp.]
MAEYDIAIVGASFGGVAAALAAARYGKRVALIEAGNNAGGQATAQGLTRWDESAPVLSPNTYGSTKSYQVLKEDVRQWYRTYTKVGSRGHAPDFNPGFASPGHPFSADCNVVETILRQMLGDAKAFVTPIFETAVVGVGVNGGHIESLALSNGDTIVAAIVIDATDLGDLLPKCGIDWTIGAEAKSDTGEPHAESSASPGHIQPITVSIAVELRPDGEQHVIPQPANYSQLVADQAFGVYDGRNGMIGGVFSSAKSANPGWETLFDYRQYIDSANFTDPNYAHDRSVINVGCNDYQAAVIPTGDAARDAGIVEAARAVSIAYLYWLQTEAPRDDGSGTGYPNLMARSDIFGRADGTAPQAYIRESRRIAKPIVRLLEQHVAADPSSPAARAPMNFADSCGICMYSIDIHQVYGPAGTPWVGVSGVKPFQIPLGSLIPTDATNVIAACKNIGGTHLTSGAYRVHPGEWAIGEAAGVLAAYCVGQAVLPAQSQSNASRLAAVQLRLLEQGIPIFWWDDLSYSTDPKTYAAAHLLGVRGFLADANDLHFRPSATITSDERNGVDAHAGKQLPWPAAAMTRAKAAVWICAELGLPSSDAVQRWDV